MLGRLLKSIATLFSLFAVIWAVDLSAQQPAHLSANYKAIFDQAQILAKDLGYTEQELIEAFGERPEETLAFLQKQTAEKRRRTTLESVKTIYVLPNRQPGSSRFDLDVVSQFMQWEKAPKHMGDIKSRPIGSCSGGYPSIIPGITIVCTEQEADAILFTAGGGYSIPMAGHTDCHATSDTTGAGDYNSTDTKVHCTDSPAWNHHVSDGMAELVDPRSNVTLWRAERSDRISSSPLLGVHQARGSSA